MPTKLQRALTWLTTAGRTSAAQARTDLGLGTPEAIRTLGDAAKADLSEAPQVLTRRQDRMRSTIRSLLATAKTAPNIGQWFTAGTGPTITQGTATTLASGYTVTVDLAVAPRFSEPAFFNVFGAAFRRKGSGFPDNNVIEEASLTVENGVLPVILEFRTDAPVFELIAKQQSAASNASTRIWVDGVLHDPLGTQMAGSAGNYPRYVTYTFSTARMRHIRLEMSQVLPNGIRVDSGNVIFKAETARRPRCIVLGDSFTEGAGSSILNGGFAARLAYATGWDVWPSGSGGSGYLASGPGARVKFRDRVQTDVILHRPDVVIIAGGINDIAFSGPAVEAEAGLLFDMLVAALPNVPIVVLGPWAPTSSPSAYISVRDAIKAAAAGRGLPFIDNIAEAWIDANNKQSFHPASLTATATATLTADAVTSVAVTNGGNAYGQRRPAVTFSGGGGSGAAGTAVTDGRIQSATVFTGGRGYDNTTTVNILGGGGSGATATATVVDGAVTGIVVTAAGTGYTSQPTIEIVGPAGSGGAIATAALTYVVTAVTVTSGGTGYTSAPIVTIAAPADPTHPNDAGHSYYAERIFFALGR